MQLFSSGLGVLVIFAGFVIMITGVGLALRVWLASRPMIRTRLCLACRYVLRANTTGRCPECGKPIPAKQRLFLDQGAESPDDETSTGRS